MLGIPSNLEETSIQSVYFPLSFNERRLKTPRKWEGLSCSYSLSATRVTDRHSRMSNPKRLHSNLKYASLEIQALTDSLFLSEQLIEMELHLFRGIEEKPR